MPFTPPPPAAPEGFTLAPGADAEPISGAARLLGGIGLAIRPSIAVPGGIILDAPAAVPSHPAGLFLPGGIDASPAVTLSLDGVGSAFLTQAEAIIMGTTPGVGTDIDNHYYLDVAGTGTGSQRVTLIGDVREHGWSGSEDRFLLGKASPTHVGGSGSVGNCHAVASTVTATANGVLAGLSAWNGKESGGGGNGVAHRMLVLSEDYGTILAASEYTQATFPNREWLDFDLIESYEFAQGDRFTLAWHTTADLGDVFQGKAPTFYGNGANGGVSSPFTKAWGQSEFVAADDPTYPFASAPLGSSWSNVFGMRGYGAPDGVLLTGSVVLTPGSVGTPPAIPSDVNVRLQWAAGV